MLSDMIDFLPRTENGGLLCSIFVVRMTQLLITCGALLLIGYISHNRHLMMADEAAQTFYQLEPPNLSWIVDGTAIVFFLLLYP